LQTVKSPPGFRSSYYKFPLILDGKINKQEFIRQLFQKYGVETGNVFYPPCHLQDVYQKLGVTSYGSLLNSEQVLARTITLPMHAGLTDEDVDYVIDKVAILAQVLS
jgi:dTDP-4-amino-4,6-dideoxygalactose transaminase